VATWFATVTGLRRWVARLLEQAAPTSHRQTRFRWRGDRDRGLREIEDASQAARVFDVHVSPAHPRMSGHDTNWYETSGEISIGYPTLDTWPDSAASDVDSIARALSSGDPVSAVPGVQLVGVDPAEPPEFEVDEEQPWMVARIPIRVILETTE